MRGPYEQGVTSAATPAALANANAASEVDTEFSTSELERELEQLSASLQRTSPQASSSGSTSPESDVFTLLHNIQRERGASAAWVASGGAYTSFGDQLAEYRAATDASISGRRALKDVLLRLRMLVDAEVTPPGSEESTEAPMTETTAAQRAQTFYTTLRAYIEVVEGVLATEIVHRVTGRGEMVELITNFCRLKENIALQRGFVTGMLALPNAAVRFLPPRAFADLVICLQQQRMRMAAVSEGASAHLLEDMMREVMRLESDELAALQARLEIDFDLSAVRATLDAHRCWELYTSHLEKLREGEVLLTTRNVSLSRQQELHRVQGIVRRSVTGISGGNLQFAERAILAQGLADLPAEFVKAQMIELLAAGGGSVRREVSSDGGGVEDLNGSAKLVDGFRIELDELRLQHRSSRLQIAKHKALPSWIDLSHATLSLLLAHSHPWPAPRPLSPLACSSPTLKFPHSTLCTSVGEGAFATTYLGIWQGARVAVKVASQSRGAMAGWRSEVQMLAQLHHPNVVRCMGAVAAPPTFCLVLEHCEGGDVMRALRDPTPQGFFWRVSQGVASGMGYLHHRGMLHRDLKSANVLLDGASAVKLTDFGLSRWQVHEEAGFGREAGTPRWMAPEVARREGFSKAADVYSFAMILIELLTHQLPFYGSSGLVAAALAAFHHLHPPLPAGMPVAIREIISLCWSLEPSERPSFENLASQLPITKAALAAEELAYLDAPEGHHAEQPAHLRMPTGQP